MKNEADAEQHLIEVAAAVEVTIERAFEYRPIKALATNATGRAAKNGQPARLTSTRRHSARHGERAMGQVDEIHQPERDGEPARARTAACVGHAVDRLVESSEVMGRGKPLERIRHSGAARSR